MEALEAHWRRRWWWSRKKRGGEERSGEALDMCRKPDVRQTDRGGVALCRVAGAEAAEWTAESCSEARGHSRTECAYVVVEFAALPSAARRVVEAATSACPR